MKIDGLHVTSLIYIVTWVAHVVGKGRPLNVKIIYDKRL